MKINLSEDERLFLKESLREARMGFEERASKYLAGSMAIEGYYENHYKPKIEQFRKMQNKLNKEKRK